MNRTLILVLLLTSCAFKLNGQQADTIRVDSTAVMPVPTQPPPDTTTQPPPPPTQSDPPPPEPQRVFYGGSLGLSFGDYFRINVSPMVGFMLTPKLTAGVKVAYEYIEDTRTEQKVTASNYGASVFGRYRFIPRAYLHAEYAYMSYEYSVANATSERDWVPFLLLGGGIVQPLGGRTSAYVEVLFDVLQDSRSPYEDWTPLISVGVAVGM